MLITSRSIEILECWTIVKYQMQLAPLHFCKNIKGSDTSEPRQGRGDSDALRGTTRRWSFHGSGRGRRPSASLCGNAFGIADESGIPGRCFRKSHRHPRAQSKVSPQKQLLKVKGGKEMIYIDIYHIV